MIDKQALQSLPALNSIVDNEDLALWRSKASRPIVVEAARAVLQGCRDKICNGGSDRVLYSEPQIIQWVSQRLDSMQNLTLCETINATGIIVHTGLGRAPLADSVVSALSEAAKYYTPVELDIKTGQRGNRIGKVEHLLKEITQCEAATVVNNTAAALMLVLSTFAKNQSVITSRGELIEIGGSFRLPDIMAAGGATLCEVGTTNKTRVNDYRRAINDDTAMLLKVHTSNYLIQGFTESPYIEELVALGKEHQLPVVYDVGSGLLNNIEHYALQHEPDVRSACLAGVDLVLFSGDKLLGGPQSGIIVGKESYISQLKASPMMRALRCDKLILSALESTLMLHRSPALAMQHVPVLNMMTAKIEDLERRANQLMNKILQANPQLEVSVERLKAYAGGGSLPDQAIDSVGLSIKSPLVSEGAIARRLRENTPSVIARLYAGHLWLDLRTVFTEQDDELLYAVSHACTAS